MSNAFREIISWVTTLPYWEQASFDHVLQEKETNVEELNKLVNFLLAGNNLLDGEITYPELMLQDYLIDETKCLPYTLNKLSNLRNINALVPNQTLTFGNHLTAIFGPNGSGKSGYARVLASAGFTRGDKVIIPDITQPYNPHASQLADIELECEDDLIYIEHHVGTPCPQLSSFYVFDSTSVIVHLTKENNISFSPSGLSYLQKFAELTDLIRGRLKEIIASRKKENIYVSLFYNESEIKTIVSELSHETNLEKLKSLATISPLELENHKTTKTIVSTIETQGISTKVSQLEKEKSDLKQFVSQIEKLQTYWAKKSIQTINNEIEAYKKNLDAANLLGFESFKSGSLRSVGTDEWLNFIKSAKSLANIEGTEEVFYPNENSHCLLCQQPLSSEANLLIRKLWEYLASETQENLNISIKKLSERSEEIKNINTNIFQDKHTIYSLIQNHNPSLISKVTDFLNQVNSFKPKALENIANGEVITDYLEELTFKSELDSLEEDIGNEIKNWQKQAEELQNLKQQIIEFEHRQILQRCLNEIEEFVSNLKWIQQASTIGGTTRHITTKYNDLFSSLVTLDYVKVFEKTLEELGRPLRVNIDTRASKGEVFKHLVLEAHESTPVNFVSPDKILSEGEKRAVALADFLTEIMLDSSSRGIILDDPVTSLDIAWRKKIAEVLVTKAQDRQVIVFTHDMPFLYYLREAAAGNGVPIDNHWIKRGDTDGQPGYIFLNNSPALERDYRNDNKARDCYNRSREASPEIQLAIVREGFGALRTSYEALIIFDVFNGVVLRFEERISFMNLSNITWDQNIVNQIIEKCELCSRYIEGHLHSDAYAAELPTIDLLLCEIEEYNTIRKKVRSLKRN